MGKVEAAMDQVFTIPVLVASVGALIAAVTDVRTLKVYNLLTVPLMVSGVAYHAVVNGGDGVIQSLCGILFGVGILLVPFLMGGMGAGDVKLLAAVGAWLGMPLTLYVFIASGIASGVCAVLMIAFQKSFTEAALKLQVMWFRMNSFVKHLGSDEWMESVVPHENRRRRVIPYGAMVAFGILVTLIWVKLQAGQ